MKISRQVARAAARKNDYWTAGTRGPRGLLVPVRFRGCQLTSATNRDHVSAKVIAAKQPRVRTVPRPARKHPAHLRHAWQRKAARAEALRRALGQ